MATFFSTAGVPCTISLILLLAGLGYRLFLGSNQVYVSGDEVRAARIIPPVFWPGLDGSACYRIPTIIRTRSGTLLAFAEQRSLGCGDSGHPNLVLRRSFDDGLTWTPDDGVLVLKKFSGNNDEDLSNVNPVEVEFPADSSDGPARRAILVHYDTRNNPTKSLHGKNMQIWSFDEGLSWHYTRDVTGQLPALDAGCMPGPSQGVWLNGVVYFTCHELRGTLLYFSTDLGRTWRWNPDGSNYVNGTNECSITAVPNQAPGMAALLMNCRTSVLQRRNIVWDVSSVGFSPLARGAVNYPLKVADFSPKELIDPNCQGSVVSLGNAVYHSNAASQRAREMLTVKKSMDGGWSWDAGMLIHPGASGYSQLVAWEASRAGGQWLGVFAEVDGYLGFAKWRVAEERSSAPRLGVLAEVAQGLGVARRQVLEEESSAPRPSILAEIAQSLGLAARRLLKVQSSVPRRELSAELAESPSTHQPRRT